jgi:ribosomal protein L32
MAHPKRQHSRQRQRKRRTHDTLTDNSDGFSVAGNPQGFNHRVDPITGMYKGVQIIEIKEKKEKKKS